jgi:hypothetical protein
MFERAELRQCTVHCLCAGISKKLLRNILTVDSPEVEILSIAHIVPQPQVTGPQVKYTNTE